MDLSDLRREYALSGLAEADLAASPFDQFEHWFNDMNRPEIIDASAMVLATVDTNNQPHQRTVLLKSFSEEGFSFFTNYESQKGLDIASNNNVNLIFAWYALERQVIISGKVEKVREQESVEYFATRPRASQVAAWVSRQSTPVSKREYLSDTFEALSEEWADKPIDKPPYWGGYIVKPSRFEFWQGRSSRLHDRLVYECNDDAWGVSRLAP